MILWINGALGSGKTTCAKLLEKQLPHAFLYDPEQAGFFIRDQLPESLQQPDVDVRHLILEANRQMLVKRLNKRFDWFNSWGKAQIDRCQSAFESDIHAEKIVTDHLSKQDVARAVADYVGLTLASK